MTDATLESLFSLAGTLAMSGWVLLVVAPRWKFTRIYTMAVLSSLVFAGLYVFLIASSFGKTGGDFNSLAGVARLFENRAALLAGWVHYLAFDLVVGNWETADAARHGIPHWLVIPCLLLTLFFGPAGLMLYILVRLVCKRVLFAAPF